MHRTSDTEDADDTETRNSGVAAFICVGVGRELGHRHSPQTVADHMPVVTISEELRPALG